MKEKQTTIYCLACRSRYDNQPEEEDFSRCSNCGATMPHNFLRTDPKFADYMDEIYSIGWEAVFEKRLKETIRENNEQ